MQNRAEWRVKNNNLEKSVVDRILENRGFTDPSDIDAFLHPDFKNHLHSPYLLRDMDIAVERIIEALSKNERIVIYGDYDADGVTATALVYDLFHQIGANFTFILPHRLNDGYGVTPTGVQKAKELGADVILTVDNGITAFEAALEAEKLGIALIITDHHQQGEGIPKAVAVINPNRKDCDYPFKHISGVGVAYKLVTALAERILSQEEAEYFLKWSLDLVAMGTVADLMCLLGENRALVHYGLKVIQKAKRPGIRALLNLYGQNNQRVNTITIGYQLGPKINAAGRLEKADIALKLLIAKDFSQAEELAKNLDEVNHQRQILTQEALEEAENLIDLSSKVMIVTSRKWHPGIIGLVAGKLCEKYHRPVIAFAYVDAENAFKGSARSPEYFDITSAMMSFNDDLVNVGGHRQAGGCTVTEEKFEYFVSNFKKYAEDKLKEVIVSNIYEADTSLTSDQITLEMWNEINQLAPFGNENLRPLFYVENMEITQIRSVGFNKRHLQLKLKKNLQYIMAIGFGLGDLSDRFARGDKIDLMTEMGENIWNNHTYIQLVVKDIRHANGANIEKSS